MITDIKVAEKALVYMLDVHIWTARRKLTADDFVGDIRDNLPPNELVSLGVKRLCSQERIRPFLMLKSRATSLLQRHGVPFLHGATIVSASAANDINKALAQIRQDFEKAKSAFMAEYDAICAEWVGMHPEYADMLKNSMESHEYVQKRISFDWHVFGLKVGRNSNIKDELADLGNSVFSDIAREARIVQKEVFTDRQTVSQKALSPIRNLGTKLRALSFIHPHISAAANLAQVCLERMPPKGEITGSDLGLVLALVTLLSDPEALEAATMRMTQNKEQPETLLMPAPPAESENIPVVPRPRSVITNVGLW